MSQKKWRGSSKRTTGNKRNRITKRKETKTNKHQENSYPPSVGWFRCLMVLLCNCIHKRAVAKQVVSTCVLPCVHSGNLHWSLPFKKWHLWARIQLCLFALISGSVFCDSVFWRTVSRGWSGRRELLSGGAASLLSSSGWCRLAFSFFGWCCVFPLLLGGAAFHLSSVGWWCFAHLFCWVVLPSSPSFGWWCFPACALRAGVFLFPGNQLTQRRRRKAARPKEGGQTAPPAREGKLHHWKGGGRTTQLNWT